MNTQDKQTEFLSIETFTVYAQMVSRVVESGGAPASLRTLFLRGITLTVYLLPPDIHWQRGDLHEPLQVPAYLHARQSGGVSQQELL